MTALLLYSGGIDSVQALYARCVQGLPTHVHHVKLANWEGRADYELRAVRATLTWLKRRYPALITETYSGFDYGNLRHVVRDHNIWGLVAGILLHGKRYRHIKQVIRTFHRDSVVGGLDSAHGRKAEEAWRSTIERFGLDVEFVYPQLNMTKGEIMQAMPAELLDLCWYCRRPKSGRPCHECHTCKQVDAALAGKPLEPLDTKGQVAKAVEAEPVVEAEGTLADESVRPNKAQSRARWAEYAEALGRDVEGLTKAQIIELVG